MRFGAKLVSTIHWAKQVEIINQGENRSSEDALTAELVKVITVFLAGLYAARSNRNRSLMDRVRAATEDTQC